MEKGLAAFRAACRAITDLDRQWAETIKHHVNAFAGLVEALHYVPEQVDLTLPRYKDADDSETVTIEVTVGWLREVRDALQTAEKEGE